MAEAAMTFELNNGEEQYDDLVLGQAIDGSIPGLEFGPLLFEASPGVPGGLIAFSYADQNGGAVELLAHAGNVAAAVDIQTDGRDSECSPPSSVSNGASASVADLEEAKRIKKQISNERVKKTRATQKGHKEAVQQELRATADKIDELNRQLEAIELEILNLKRQNAEQVQSRKGTTN